MMHEVVVGPHSLLVHGVKRTALYDVARQRCIRLPRQVFGDILSASPQPSRRMRATANVCRPTHDGSSMVESVHRTGGDK